ncbi:MAG: hypothetical protein JSU86_10310 [Phycisphaerales bacterium]|nr:MAG: hypothetical protein JSU86_10310 [Phycisphaerales bacterium]
MLARTVCRSSGGQAVETFFVARSDALRRILVVGAYYGGRMKRCGGRVHFPLLDEPATPNEDRLKALALDETPDKVEQDDAFGVDVVKVRYFVSLSIDEYAAILGTSPGQGIHKRKVQSLGGVVGRQPSKNDPFIHNTSPVYPGAQGRTT